MVLTVWGEKRQCIIVFSESEWVIILKSYAKTGSVEYSVFLVILKWKEPTEFKFFSLTMFTWFSSVQFSRSVMPSSLRPHKLQHARHPCLSTIPGVHSNSCPLSRWCHPAISSSVVPFSSALNLSQHQGLSQWVSSLHQVARVLEFQLQYQSFQWTPRTDLL